MNIKIQIIGFMNIKNIRFRIMKKTDEMIKMSAGELLNYNVCGWITLSMYRLQCQWMNYNVGELTTMSVDELQCR
jgi:hypothetical protein